MKIREILNLMEEIEKNHHDKHHGKTYGAANAGGDDELDDPVGDPLSKVGGEPRDGKKNAPSGSQHGSHHHHKHHQHHDTRAQQIDKEFGGVAGGSKDDESGDEDFDNAMTTLKKYCTEVGPDLVAFSAFDYKKKGHYAWEADSDQIERIRDLEEYLPGIGPLLDKMAKANIRENGVSLIFINTRNGKSSLYQVTYRSRDDHFGHHNEKSNFDPDQLPIIKSLYEMFIKLRDQEDRENWDKASDIKEVLLNTINYKSRKTFRDYEWPEWKRAGYGSEEEMLKARKDSDEAAERRKKDRESDPYFKSRQQWLKFNSDKNDVGRGKR